MCSNLGRLKETLLRVVSMRMLRNSFAGWNLLGNADQCFVIPVRQNLGSHPLLELLKIVRESGMSVLSKGLVQGANFFPSDESLSEFNLLVNYSGIHSQQSHLFTIVLPSDHLPSMNTCPLGTPTNS